MWVPLFSRCFFSVALGGVSIRDNIHLAQPCYAKITPELRSRHLSPFSTPLSGVAQEASSHIVSRAAGVKFAPSGSLQKYRRPKARFPEIVQTALNSVRTVLR
jgi:hypothetical protein